jgi:hypothetical protein
VRSKLLVFLAMCGLLMALGPGASGQSRSADGIGGRDAVAVPTSHSAGACLRFDDLASGTALTVYRDVTFTNTDGGLTVQAQYPGPPFSPPNAVLPDFYSTPGNRSSAMPRRAVKAAAVTLGDYDADEDAIYLEAYDADGNLVASDSAIVPASLNGGIQLHVSVDSAVITRIDFWGVGGSENSVYFDNVCFAR